MALDYTGYKETVASEQELANLYENASENTYCCLTNEYLIVKDDNGEVIDYLRWDGDKYLRASRKNISNDWSGKISPRNPQQVVALDMLQNTDITIKILSGKWGVGKNFLMTASALDLIKKNKYQKIVWIRNNQNLANTSEIGHLPGDEFSKLLPWAMPLADHVGGVFGLEMLIKQQSVEIVHLGHIRGRSFHNAIIFCDEIENNTVQHVQLLIGRVGEGSAIWMSGDWNQTDKKVFQDNSGLLTAIDRLKGHRKFGYIHLLKTERSETAEMASLLDV